MSKKLAEDPEVPEEETPAATELYYEINTNGGDVYLTINAGRKSKLEVMSGEAPPPPRPPKP